MQLWQPKPKPGPPVARKAGIELEEIVDAAAAIADRDGLAAATLGAVAMSLGIKPPSLHYRVGGADGLRRLLAFRSAAIVEELFVASLHDPDPLRSMCRAYRTFGLEHPGLFDAALPAAGPDDADLYEAQARPVEVVLQAMEGAELPEEDLIHVVRAVRAALHGFIDNERRGGFGMPLDIDESFEHMLDLLLPPNHS